MKPDITPELARAVLHLAHHPDPSVGDALQEIRRWTAELLILQDTVNRRLIDVELYRGQGSALVLEFMSEHALDPDEAKKAKGREAQPQQDKGQPGRVSPGDPRF